MQTADVIDRAADLIWLHGRCVGIGSEDGKFCVVGAFVHVLVEEERRFGEPLLDKTREIGDVLRRYLSRPGVVEFASTFNDRLPINAENDALVVDTLRRCAKELRECGE